MKFPSRSFSLLVAGCLLAGLRASAEPPADDSAVIARAGDTELKAAEVRETIRGLDANTQAAIARDPSALSQVVRLVVTQRLVLQEAQAAKWDQNAAAAAQIARARDNAVIETYLQSVSQPPETYPSDSEVQSAYDANKGALLVPRQYRLAQVFVRSAKGAPADAAAKAQVKLDGIRKRLREKGADFATVARAESDEPDSAAKGGEIGWLAESRIQPEIRAQLGSLAKGSTSEPVRLDDGWHILKVLEVKEPYTPALAEIRPQLARRMRAERAKALSQAYVEKLVQEHPIEVNELSLSKILSRP